MIFFLFNACVKRGENQVIIVLYPVWLLSNSCSEKISHANQSDFYQLEVVKF